MIGLRGLGWPHADVHRLRRQLLIVALAALAAACQGKDPAAARPGVSVPAPAPADAGLPVDGEIAVDAAASEAAPAPPVRDPDGIALLTTARSAQGTAPITSVVRRGHVVTPAAHIDAPLVTILVFPDKLRVEDDTFPTLETLDGDEAWLSIGGDEPTALPDAIVAEMKGQLWMDVAVVLANALAPDASIGAPARVTIDGHAYDQLVVQGRGGPPVTLSIDPATHRLLRRTYHVTRATGDHDATDDFTDWRRVGDIWVPFRAHHVEIPVSGDRRVSDVVWRAYRLNEAVAASEFAKPTARKRAR